MQRGRPHSYISPETMMREIRHSNCSSVAFTYNEPIVFSEYAMAIAELAEKENYPCIYVTNGYISDKAREQVFSRLSAVNIDLKAFTDAAYKKYIGGTLRPVLDTIRWCVENNIHTEITCLLIPGVNDDESSVRSSCEWILKYCGADTPLHLNAFHPDYKMMDHPMTSRITLENARNVARESGLNYVYVGNYPGFDNNTYCPECGELLIERRGYQVRCHPDHRHPSAIHWS
jgi:pyruvate formate lyase activating enzyme